MDEDFPQDLVKALKEVVDSNRWQNIGAAEKFKTKKCTRLLSEDGEDMVIVFVAPDKFYAMDASCPHAGGPMNLGDIEDIGGHMSIICPWHGYSFRLDDGSSPTGLQQQMYTVKVLEGNIYVNTSSELLVPSSNTTENCEDSKEDISSAVVPSNADTLCDWAVRILMTADPHEKVQLTHKVKERWDSGDIKEIGSATPPSQPHRQDDLQVLAPGKIKRGKAGTKASRIAVLHSLANIEQWAIDLSWDVIARFSDISIGQSGKLPREFFTDFVKVASDEAKHFNLLQGRLKELGSHFGALPVHNGLWHSAGETKDSLLARLAIVHMVHEARGLDVHPITQARFARQNDTESVSLLEVIYKDEITHVAAGMKWFTYICKHSDPEMDCIPKFHELVRQKFRGHLKPPFNEEGRQTAGMTKEWYVPLMKPSEEDTIARKGTNS
ncbi:Rieske domain-containing protein [Holothuria leucospilota]|uniref:Rieske domain-containing protein n=1 Tax=Holothuria leucospilota TaxID=206669 RepID=A0A9Q1H870_HOLLE|nr:Rieske domain-containing protein [Holothuria leucospilota]